MDNKQTRIAPPRQHHHQQSNSSIDSSINKSWSHPSQWDTGEELVLEPGLIIRENYRLIEKLGEGGMGVVWKAVDLIQEAGDSRNPYVAIKFLSRDFKQHPDALKALVREFSRYQRLTDPNIIKAYGLDRIESTFFMVMEFLEGIPLNQFIKENPNGISLSEAEYIINDMAEALEHAHENGVAHLDFKPANVFYDEELNTTTVIDFGIARPIEQSEREKTRYDPGKLGALTDPYASHEMLLGLDPDPRDDIYGLACVTYELLSGKHPFNRKKATQAELDKLVPKPIKGLSRQQNQALLHALAFNRDDRTPTAAQFLDELFPEEKENKLGVVGKSFIILLVLVIAGISALTFLKKPQYTEIKTPITKVQQPIEPPVVVEPEIQTEPPPLAKQTTPSTEVQQSVEQPQVIEEPATPQQQIEPPTLACKQSSLTKRLLIDANNDILASRIIYPDGDNAVEKYQQVLKLCPSNEEAKNGLHKIGEFYKGKAKGSLIIGRIERCKRHIDNALRAVPNDPDLIDFCKK